SGWSWSAGARCRPRTRTTTGRPGRRRPAALRERSAARAGRGRAGGRMDGMTDVPPAAPASPFDPPGVVWQPVSPRLITVRYITLALSVGLPFLVTVVIAAVAG